MARSCDTVRGRGEQDGSFARIVRHVTSNREVRAEAVDSVADEVEIALAIPCFILCAMCPQVRNLTSIEDVLLSFSHGTAPFCGIDCVQTHPDRGVFEFRENGLR